MDFATRNLYRNAIEVLARGAPLSELAHRETGDRPGRQRASSRASAIPASG